MRGFRRTNRILRGQDKDRCRVKIEDSFIVAAPPQRVWAMITDPECVGPCIPGCQAIEVTGPNSYKADVKMAVGPIKTTFSVTVEVTEERAPSYVASVTRGEEGGRASTLTAHNVVELKPAGDGATEIFYASEVSIFGRLGKFGLGIMKKKAKQLGNQFAEAFRLRVEGG